MELPQGSGSGAGGSADRETEVDIGEQRFAAREVILSERPAISAIVLKSRDEVIAPFRRIQNGVLLIGLLCAAVAAAGSFWIAKDVDVAVDAKPRWRLMAFISSRSHCSRSERSSLSSGDTPPPDSPVRTCSCAAKTPRSIRPASVPELSKRLPSS